MGIFQIGYVTGDEIEDLRQFLELPRIVEMVTGNLRTQLHDGIEMPANLCPILNIQCESDRLEVLLR